MEYVFDISINRYPLDEKVRWFGPRFVRKYRVDVAVVFVFSADTRIGKFAILPEQSRLSKNDQ